MPEFSTDDGVGVHYTVRGRGCPAIYLHCMGGSTATWHGLWDVLGDDEYQHIGLDFRGHGGSAGEPGELTNERLSRDVLQLADELGLGRFAVVGHSMGAKVGMRLAALAPERVSALALIGSPGPGLVPLRREDVAEFLVRYHDLDTTRAFFRNWFHVWPNARADAWLREFSALPGWALEASARMSLWTDIRAALTGLRAPVLVVAGADDPVYGPAYQRSEVLPHFPRAQMEVVHDCGHGLVMEQPAAIAAVVAPFLARYA